MNFGGLDDAMMTSDVYGRVVRVFKPKWWQVRRLLKWLLSKDGITTRIAWILPIRDRRLWRSNGFKEVRAYLVPRRELSPRVVPVFDETLAQRRQ